MDNNRQMRSLISGGGNQENIMLAVRIADRLKKINPANVILFIGVEDREEMGIVSRHGYDIVGIPAASIVKGPFMSYVLFPIRTIRSILRTKRQIRTFKPDIAIRTGGYASSPLIWKSSFLGVQTLVIEREELGVVGKILHKRTTSAMNTDDIHKIVDEAYKISKAEEF